MSTDKGGSDLDVFNDLKPQTPDGKPITDTKRTLMGLQAPEGSFPPVPGSAPSSSRSIPPPPPSQRPRRSPGAPPLPPPSHPNASPSRLDQTPLAPAARGGRGARADEEDRGEDTSPGVPPDSAPLTPRSDARGLGLDSWATTQPAVGGPRVSIPPSPQISTLHDTLTSDSVASAAVPAAAGTGDVGWDDDDDKTTIYDKDTQAAAQSLLQPVTHGLAGRPPPPMSRPPGAILPPGVVLPGTGFGARTTIPPTPHDASFALPMQPAPSQRLPYIFALAGAVIVAVLFWMVLPKKGTLTVTVAGGPGNKPPAAVEVIVDNKVRCRESPCEIPNLKAGTHYVEVRAAGYQATAKSAVAIVGDQTAVHNVQLIRAGTGIKVFGEGTGLTLLVDGNEFGPLPQELREMEPGEHVIQVSGGSRYEVFQQRIVVDADRMTPIGPIKLKVVKGLATIRAGAGADEAEVTLKVGDSRRVLPALPVRLEVETDRPHVLIAKRKGFATFEQPITFEDGQAEKTIEISLTERAAEEVIARRRRPGPAGSPSGAAEGPEPSEVAEPEPVGAATLNISSTPPSNVLLDGKPLGTTPLQGVSVEPGTHRVIFIHGAERKPKTVEVEAGKAHDVSVRF